MLAESSQCKRIRHPRVCTRPGHPRQRAQPSPALHNTRPRITRLVGNRLSDSRGFHQNLHWRRRDPHRSRTAILLYHLRPPVSVDRRMCRRCHLGNCSVQTHLHAVECLRRHMCGPRLGSDLVRHHGCDGHHGRRLCACADFYPQETVHAATDQVWPDVRPGAGQCGCIRCRLSLPILAIL